MTKKMTKIAITAAVAVMAVAAIGFYFKLSQALTEPVTADEYHVLGNDVIGPVEETQIDFGPAFEENTDSETAETLDSAETTYAPPDVDVDIGDIMDYIGEKYSDEEGILGDVRNRKLSALTVTFDGVTIQPGMAVCDIIDTSYWYTIRENDILDAGSSTFLTLDNDFWNEKEINLTEKKTIRNGDVVLWVHNYSDEPALIRDCTIYKYQISYLGCWDQFSERPPLDYRGIYHLGTTDFPDTADHITSTTLDTGSCDKYCYGDSSACEVVLYANEHGLAAITVTFNEYYGPYFDRNEVKRSGK